jgi:hypothetical protein
MTVCSDLQIQKIALLDLRLLNCDRNDENVLVVKKSIDSHEVSTKSDAYELVPIDHAYCLPAQLRIESWDWFWFNYPQVRKPICPEIIDYFKSLDIDQLIENLLMEVSVSANCVFLLRLIHHVISQSIDKGLTLYDIASLVARTDETTPSPLEKIIIESESNSYVTIDARSSRFNSHASSYKVSTSFDTPKMLSFVPDEVRRRSQSITESNSGWNSPTRRAIYTSTEKLFQSDLNNIPVSDNLKKSSASYQYHLSDSECDMTDDSSVSTFTELSSPSTDYVYTLPSAVIRGVSHDTYLQNYHINSKGSNQSPDLSLFDRRVQRSSKFQRIDSWDIKLSSHLKTRDTPCRELRSPNVGIAKRYDNSTPVFSSILVDHTANHYHHSMLTAAEESFPRGDYDSSTSTTPGHSSDSGLSQPSILRRMVSFAAIPSEPMYDLKSTYEEKLSDALQQVAVEPFDIVKGRRVPKKVLQQHVSHESSEFQSLRQHFAENLVKFTVSKIAHERNHGRP